MISQEHIQEVCFTVSQINPSAKLKLWHDNRLQSILCNRYPWTMDDRGFPRPSVQCTLRSCRARRHGTHIKQVLRGNHGHVRRQPWGSQHSTFRWVLVGCIGIPGRAGLGASFCSRSTHFKRLILFL